MKNFKHLVLLILISALSAGSAAVAQGQTGGMKGKVRSANGDGVSGAAVTARQNGQDIKTVQTDRKGKFEMSGLSAGTYNLIIDKNGYGSGLLSNVEIKTNQTRDLGDRLILAVDKGTLVIIQGSVFDQNGRSVSGAKIEISKTLSDGTVQKIKSGYASSSGEFTFKFAEGTAAYLITASAKGNKASKEVKVDNAAIYRLAINLKLDN